MNEGFFVLQILGCGTSIAANIEEALGGTTNKEFINRMNISFREAGETLFWLKLINDSKLIESEQVCDLIADIEELLKIIGKTRYTMKNKLNIKFIGLINLTLILSY